MPSTIKNYVNTLATLHKLRGFDEHFSSNYMLKFAIRGAENLSIYKDNKSRGGRLAMSLPLLKILGNEIARSNWSKINKQVLWSACTVAFFGSCRLGELLSENENSYDPFTTLLWGDVIFHQDSMVIHVKSPKSRVPQGEFIDLFRSHIENCCPFKSLSFLYSITSTSDQPTLPVFMFDSGKLLTKQKFNATIRGLLAAKFGKKSNLLSGHSFRQGIPSLLAKYPELVKDSHVMGWGRWCSDAYLSYTKLKTDQKRCIYEKIITLLNK